MDQLRSIRESLIKELQIDELEADIFMALMKVEKTTSQALHKYTNLADEQIIEISKTLEQKGMVIEINKNVFRALHPRFAIVNRYRRICEANNTPFKKNIKIDNLGIILERYQAQK